MTLEGVAATAVSTARIRAAESRRPDRLFDDPLAIEIARASGSPEMPATPGTPPSPLREVLRLHVVVRTRYYDDFVSAAVASGCRQVVLLGAGYDARAFRLEIPPGIDIYELDQAAVMEAKEVAIQRLGLRPVAARHPVPVDLGSQAWPSALTRAGHDPSAATAWLLEGLLVYLDDRAATRLLSVVDDASPAGSRLACEFTTPRAYGAAVERHPDVEAAQWWLGGPRTPVDAWLAARGWRCRRTTVAEVAAECGRTMPPDVRAVAAVRGFVTGEASRQAGDGAAGSGVMVQPDQE